MTLFMDVDFLAAEATAYSMYQLSEGDDNDAGAILEQRMHQCARIIMGVLMVFKMVAWQGLLTTCPQGKHALDVLWRRFKLLLPIWGSPSKLTKEVYNRIVALAWIHLLGSMALITMAGVAGTVFNWAPQFTSSEGAGVPLSALCLTKSMTCLLVAAALFRNMDLALCMNVFGCLACFQSWHQARETRRRRKHGVTYPKVVILEWEYIMMCCWVKIFDLVIGVWFWTGLGWSFSEDHDYSERRNIRLFLIAIATVETLTDIWSVFLGITVCLLVSQYLLRKEHDAKMMSMGQDDDVEIARSLATGRLLSEGGPFPVDSGDLKRRIEEGSRPSFWGEESVEDESTTTNDEFTTSDESQSDDSDGQAYSRSAQARGRSMRGNQRDSRSSNRRGTVSSVLVDLDPGDGDIRIPELRDSEGRVAPPETKSHPEFRPGSRLVYKRAFSARSSSDDASFVNEGENHPPAQVTAQSVELDHGFAMSPEDYRVAWDSLDTSASFRCRIGSMPDVATVAAHLHDHGFFVVASGIVSGHTKIYACARGEVPGWLSSVFLLEMVFEKEMHELSFAFKCHDRSLTPLFVRHLHLRRVIKDHQPIA
ncbi:unnamed protein product [Discosporangium mesarthrocarpum]